MVSAASSAYSLVEGWQHGILGEIRVVGGIMSWLRRGQHALARTQQLAAFFVDATLQLGSPGGKILEPLFVQRQGVGIRPHADLDRSAGLVRVDVVQRRIRRAAG